MPVNGFVRRYWRFLLTLVCSGAVIVTAQSCQSRSRSGESSALLIITSVTSSSLTAGGATITWSTNKPADSGLEYGPTTGYGNQMSVATMETNHSLTLIGLTANTTYNYRVKSKDDG